MRNEDYSAYLNKLSDLISSHIRSEASDFCRFHLNEDQRKELDSIIQRSVFDQLSWLKIRSLAVPCEQESSKEKTE